MAKRVKLVCGFEMDVDSNCMTLKNNIKMVVNAKGEEVESSNIQGYFTNYKSLFKKMHSILVVNKLEKNEDLAGLKNAIKSADEQINRLCRLLETGYDECSVEFGSVVTEDSDDNEVEADDE